LRVKEKPGTAISRTIRRGNICLKRIVNQDRQRWRVAAGAGRAPATRARQPPPLPKRQMVSHPSPSLWASAVKRKISGNAPTVSLRDSWAGWGFSINRQSLSALPMFIEAETQIGV